MAQIHYGDDPGVENIRTELAAISQNLPDTWHWVLAEPLRMTNFSVQGFQATVLITNTVLLVLGVVSPPIPLTALSALQARAHLWAMEMLQRLRTPMEAKQVFDDPRIARSVTSRTALLCLCPPQTLDGSSLLRDIPVLWQPSAVEEMGALIQILADEELLPLEQQRLVAWLMAKKTTISQKDNDLGEEAQPQMGLPKAPPTPVKQDPNMLEPQATGDALSEPKALGPDDVPTRINPMFGHIPPPIDELNEEDDDLQGSVDRKHRSLNLSNFLRDIERHLKSILEGGGSGSPLIQYDQMIRALEQELESTLLTNLPMERIARNHFVIHLSEADMEYYAPFKDRVIGHLMSHLQRVIQTRSYVTEGALNIELKINTTLASGACLVTSIFARDDSDGVPLAQAWLEVSSTGERVPVNRSYFTIGRHASCNLSLNKVDQAKITSRHHAHIRSQDGQYFLYDGVDETPSSAGTFVRGSRLSHSFGQPLRNGDHIILGPHQRWDEDKPMEGSILLIFRTSKRP